MFRVGQHVRVRSLQEIAKTLDRPIENCDNTSYNQNVHFCMDMEAFCGYDFYVDFIDEKYGHITLSQDDMTPDALDYINYWVWDELWLEPVKPVVQLPEELFNV
jgi:hypothetical protein